MQNHVFNFNPEQLCSKVAELGESITLPEARRVLAHVYSNGNLDLSQMKRPVRASLQTFLKKNFSQKLLTIKERVQDPIDNSTRFVFESFDGRLSEAVRIALKKEGHYSVCLSSQVGCAMACDFCATGRLGLKRNLEPWEIIAQFWQIKKETKGVLSGAVFMGQGEPFHNYDNVIQAAQILSSPTGLRVNAKNITISTVGLVPQIRRYTKEAHPFRLIVSLTTAIADKRKQMLPIANTWPVDELADAIKERAAVTKDRVTLAWVLMKGFNTGQDEVKALTSYFKDVPIVLNLIDVNDSREDGYERPCDGERDQFLDQLKAASIPFTRRYSVGNASDSACGMLAAKAVSDAKIATQ